MEKLTHTFTTSECIDLLYGQSKQESPVQLNKLKILTNIEQYLSKKLNEICFQDGTEKDTNESAIIFHKLGLVYRKRTFVDTSNQKRCLIKSAVLFNAALVRKPSNVQIIQDDLNELCSHVWCLAGVTKENVKLTEQPEFLSNLSRHINSLRNHVETKVYCLRKRMHESSGDSASKRNLTEIFEKLQDHIYNKYCKLMENVTKYCISLKARVPCKFALIGMGSLAKKEITPYSDFEHALVLQEGIQNEDNYQEILEYFRWFSVIFHISVINLGETIIPSICLPFINNPLKKSFNWFFDANTIRGISFDGMMPHACKFPLGREETKMKFWKTELIQPISEMLKYLATNDQSRRDYRLADMLKTTCFVAGDKEIYQTFQQNVRFCKIDMAAWQSLVSKDIKTFNPFKTLPNMLHTAKWNLKRVVYRSFGLFVEVLGKLYNLEANSGFEIIRTLVMRDIFDQQFGEDLLFAATAAYYLRLISYSKANSQNDYLRCPENPKEYAKIFGEWVGIKSAVHFFKVVLKLQRLASFKIGLIGEDDFKKYTDIHYYLHSCWLLRQFSNAVGYCAELLNNSKSSICDIAFASHTLYHCGSDAYHAKDYVKAKEYLFEAINNWKSWRHRLSDVEFPSPENVAASLLKASLQDEDPLIDQQVKMYIDVVAHTFNRLGRCFYQEGLFYLALEQHEVAVQLTKNVVGQEISNTNIAIYLKNMGKCMLKTGHWVTAYQLFAKAANIWKESLHEAFILDIKECKDCMRLCILLLERSRIHKNRVFPRPPLQRKKEIDVDSVTSQSSSYSHAIDIEYKEVATERLIKHKARSSSFGLQITPPPHYPHTQTLVSDVRPPLPPRRSVQSTVSSYELLTAPKSSTAVVPKRIVAMDRSTFNKSVADIASQYELLTARTFSRAAVPKRFVIPDLSTLRKFPAAQECSSNTHTRCSPTESHQRAHLSPRHSCQRPRNKTL